MLKFTNKIQIEKLRELVRVALNKHIDRDYVLLDIPNYRNIGDTLIWEGELEYLNELEYKCNYSCNPYTFRSKCIGVNDIILLQGGGNFGDFWKVNQSFRNSIIEGFPNNRIIIFPQTIYYLDENNLKIDASIYNKHKDLIICVRDSVSYSLAKEHFYNCKIYMLPDMAFFLNMENFQVNQTQEKTLIMKRVDKELGSETLINEVERQLNLKQIDYDIKDWPGFLEEGTFKRKIQGYINKIEIRLSKRLLKIPILQLLVNDKHGLKGGGYKDRLISKGVNFINNYDTVYSTRLHGFILAVLLDKKVFIFDNSYGKNKNFFETWLTEFENVKLIER